MRQLILQYRHVTYREMETTLGISGTSIYSILHRHLTVKKNLFALDTTQFVNRSRKVSKEMFQKYDRGASKYVYDIVTGDESWNENEPNPTKVVRAQSSSTSFR